MDYSSFCREIYTRLSSRLPLHLQSENDSASLIKQGGWYFPSLRDKDAWFFDLRKAYSYFLSGSDCSVIADAMEFAFLKHQWNQSAQKISLPSSPDLPMKWALRIRPEKEKIMLPDGAYYLSWEKYILEPCCRHGGSRLFYSLLPVEIQNREREGTIFWDFFWDELIRQNPPALFISHLHQPHQEIPLKAEFFRNTPHSRESSYILTNQGKIYGAAVLFYPNLLQIIAHFLGDYYLLISSPHELMLFPGKGELMGDILSSALEEGHGHSSEQETGFTPALYLYTVERGLLSF